MREPPLRVRLLGHPIVVAPVMGLGLFMAYQWTQRADAAVPAMMALAAIGLVGRAAQHRMEYVRWQRAWNSMADGDRGSPRRGPLAAKLAIAITVPVGFLAVQAGAFAHAEKAVAWALLAALAVGCWAVIRGARRWLAGGVHQPASGGAGGRRARAASRSDVVSICARSSMRVPSLEDAYKALPAHCWRVLNSGSN